MKQLAYRCSDFPKNDIDYQGMTIKINQLERIFTELIYQYVISEDEYIHVHSAMFKSISNDYRSILEYLAERQIIIINEIYSTGNFSKSYLFTEVFKQKVMQLIVEIEAKLINTRREITNNYIKSSRNHIIDLSIQNKLFIDFISLHRKTQTTNYLYFKDCRHVDEFKKAMSNLYFDTQSIYNKGFYKLDNENNRLYTSFCNINKEIRQSKYFFNEGKKLLNKDIKSSHILFLAQLLLSDYREGKLDVDEYYKFLSLVLEPKNDIYEYFKVKYYPWMKRKRVKTLFFILMFGDNDTKKKLLKLENKDEEIDYKGHNIRINDNFNFEFSTLFNAIKERKWIDDRLDKSRFTKELNKLEADFLFNRVIKRLYREAKDIQIVTVHDQFYYSEEYEELVNTIWEDELKKLFNQFDHITMTSYYAECAVEPKDYMKPEFADINLSALGINVYSSDDKYDLGVSLQDICPDLYREQKELKAKELAENEANERKLYKELWGEEKPTPEYLKEHWYELWSDWP